MYYGIQDVLDTPSFIEKGLDRPAIEVFNLAVTRRPNLSHHLLNCWDLPASEDYSSYFEAKCVT